MGTQFPTNARKYAQKVGEKGGGGGGDRKNIKYN